MRRFGTLIKRSLSLSHHREGRFFASNSLVNSSKDSPAPYVDVEAKAVSKKKKIGPLSLIKMKAEGEKFTMMTAYDVSSASICEAAGIDLILVGDSLGNVIQGKNSTRPVTMDDMVYHLRCVTPHISTSLVVGDMPFGSYEISTTQAVQNAIRLVKEGGAAAVKLEGFHPDAVRAIVQAGVPVMAHLGLLPQTATLKNGNFGTSGTTAEDAMILIDQAMKVQEAGAFSIVFECVTAPVAAYVTSQLRIPTIGIGAGPGTTAQVLVFHDVLGLFTDFQPKFVKRYADLGTVATKAIAEYANEVRTGKFPTSRYSFAMPLPQWEAFEKRVLLAASADGADSVIKALAHSAKLNPKKRAQLSHTSTTFPSEDKPLRIAVVGGGSLGSLIAATLAKTIDPKLQRVNVLLVSRWEEHRNVVNKLGLRLFSSDGRLADVFDLKAINYPPNHNSVDDPIEPVDIAIVCVKSLCTQAAGEATAALLRPGGVCLTLQNGLGNVERLRETIPKGCAIAQGVTTAGAALQSPGHVRWNGAGKTEIALAVCSSGEELCTICTCGAQTLLSKISFALNARGLPCEITGDATETLWKKLAISCGVNAVTAILRLSNGDVAAAEPAARVVALAAAEAANVARAYGVELDPEAVAQSALAVARDTAPNTSSMLADLLQGRHTEIDQINRAVALAGIAKDIPCPVNSALADLVAAASATFQRRIPDAEPPKLTQNSASISSPITISSATGTISVPTVTPTRSYSTRAAAPSPPPKVLRTICEVREWVKGEREAGRRVGLVPTMGYLHDGHLSLVEEARKHGCHSTMATIFVNPKQFAAHEDLGTYPRDTQGDIEKLRRVGTNAVWIPEVEEMYPTDFSTEVRVVSPLTQVLCGKSRPHFFGGVATVVLKILLCVGPDVAVFGSKDYQQVLVVQRMVKDLCVPVEIVSAPLLREADGVAMSSRNARLTAEGRRIAPALFRGLTAAQEAYRGGERRPGTLREVTKKVLSETSGVEIDYVDVLDGNTLLPLDPSLPTNNKMVMAIAATVGGVRLIDNTIFEEK